MACDPTDGRPATGGAGWRVPPLPPVVVALLCSCVISGADPGAVPDAAIAPQPSYEVLDLQVISPLAGETLWPEQQIVYDFRYKGVLANAPSFTAVLTHEDSGAVIRIPNGVEVGQDRQFQFRRRWTVRHEALKQSGRFRVHMEVSLRATLKGAEPWVKTTAPLSLNLAIRLDAVRAVTTGTVPYGTPITVEVDGHDLWAPVTITALDEAGQPLPGAETTVAVPPAGTARHSWIIKSPAIERVGTHPVRLVARFGDLSAESAPVSLVLTHTIDFVKVLARFRDGTEGLRSPNRLSDVAELVVRARGTQLAGHEVTINGGAPMVAASDEILITRVPRDADFASGKSSHSYSWQFVSGGVERSGSIGLTRWGLTGCGWFGVDGQPVPAGTVVNPGTPVLLRAFTWGFPDTRTTLGIFKDRQATFQVLESDEGRDIRLGPGADDVDDFDADIRGDLAEARWTTRFDEETNLLIISRIHAELFFEVVIEDQKCTSTLIRVPNEP
jgi:hypothetical protein